SFAHTPDDSACSDGLYCDGAETCSAVNGCQAGSAPATDDGVPCTVDACDEATDVVTHVPTDVACDDGQYCNGAEVCNSSLGCLSGSAPSGDDGVGCTIDNC